MRLELNILNIRDVQFADETTIRDGILRINKRELQNLLQEDKRLSHVDIELAHPGEKCRIIQVSDVVEPRAKTDGSDADFPGALGKVRTAGEGTTCVLRGVAVVMSEYAEVRRIARDPDVGIIDMTGPAAELSIYGKTHHVVVLPYPANGIRQPEYQVALKLAGLKTAVYLARAGQDLEPDETEVYDLPPVTEVAPGLEELPRVAYIFQALATQYIETTRYPVLYGGNANAIVPTILHPNEVLDGALLNHHWSRGMETYVIQNHPIIKELYRGHGKSLRFVGVIVTIAYENEAENDRAAVMVANLARSVLGADGVILTKSGGGFPELPMAWTAQRCEELGVKTALAQAHYAADVSDATFEGSLISNLPEVNAIVSMGSPWSTITIPPVERVIGKPVALPEGFQVSGEIETTLQWTLGIVGQLGSSRLILARY